MQHYLDGSIGYYILFLSAFIVILVKLPSKVFNI